MSDSLPKTIVSQQDKDEREADYYYQNPEFVMVNGEETHIWVNGVHFVEESNGAPEEEKYLCSVTDPGIYISQILEVGENEVKVEHQFYWSKQDETVKKVDEVGTWEIDVINGQNVPSLGGSTRVFLLSRR